MQVLSSAPAPITGICLSFGLVVTRVIGWLDLATLATGSVGTVFYIWRKQLSILHWEATFAGKSHCGSKAVLAYVIHDKITREVIIPYCEAS
jgi:hypothetical protein